MTWPPLEPGEVLMPDPDSSELVLRAVREEHVDDGVVGPGAFALSTDDRKDGRNRLSGARATKQTPEGVRQEQNDLRPGSCAEVRGITVGEVEAAGPLRVIDDSANVPDVTGHASIDMRLLEPEPPSARKLARAALAISATDRGRLDQPSA